MLCACVAPRAGRGGCECGHSGPVDTFVPRGGVECQGPAHPSWFRTFPPRPSLSLPPDQTSEAPSPPNTDQPFSSLRDLYTKPARLLLILFPG